MKLVNLEDSKDEIRKMIAEIIEVEYNMVKDDTKFVEDLGVDSLMALEIVVGVEKKYRVKISPEKIPTIRTLENIMSLLKELVVE